LMSLRRSMRSGLRSTAAVSDMENVAQISNVRQVEAEACAWIAQLDGGEPSQEDLDAFREWIHRSPRHQEEIKRLSAIWGDLNVLTELAVPIKARRRIFLYKLNLRVAAIAFTLLFGVIGSAYVLWPVTHIRQVEANTVFATAIGERKPVTLSDGSKVLLNTDSRVQLEYTPDQRAVRLLQGEAFFEVAHNADRPFLVYAGGNVVRAVGTAFSVHIQKHDVAVVVTEGTVELASVSPRAGGAQDGLSKPRTIKLVAINAGQGATIDDRVEAIETIKPAEVTRKLSWREGVLSFSGEPLEQVVQEVSRYTPVTIVISDPSIRNVAIGGYFKAGETESMFEALETSFGVRVTRVNDRLVYLAAK
jgi:transmembrane sensor